jgi:hypothetical protein
MLIGVLAAPPGTAGIPSFLSLPGSLDRFAQEINSENDNKDSALSSVGEQRVVFTGRFKHMFSR